MIRWLTLGLILVCGVGVHAQTADMIREVSEGSAGRVLRPNPLGGGVVQVQLFQAAAQPVPLQPAPKMNPPPGVPGAPGGVPPATPPRRLVRPTIVRTGPIKLDQYGDPIPFGALARYGTIRLRHGPEPVGLGFSHDGKFLGSIAPTEDGIRIWDPVTGKELHRLNAPVSFAAFARDGSVLVVDDGRCKVWIPANNTVRNFPEKTLPDGAQAIAVHPDCRSFVVGAPQKIVQIDLQTGKPIRDLKYPGDQPPTRIVFSPDGRWLAASGQKTGVWLWDLRTGKRVRTYPSEFDFPECTFSPNGTRIAISGDKLRVLPTDSEEPLDDYKIPEGALHNPRFSEDGKWVFGISPEGAVFQVNADTGEAKEPWNPPDVALHFPMAISPNASFAAALDQSGGIKIWDPRTGKGPEVERLPALSEPAFSADGKTVWCLAMDGHVHGFEAATGKRTKLIELMQVPDDGQPVFWDPATRRVAVIGGGEEIEIQVIDVETNRIVSKIGFPASAGMPFIAFCVADRTRVALFGQGSVMVVNVTTGKTIRNVTIGKAEESPPLRGAISPDGRLVAISAHPLSVWEVATGKKRFELDGMLSPEGAIFSRDGRYLAGWDGTGTVAVFDLRLGTLVRRIQTTGAENGNGGLTVAFSHDGNRIAAGERDGSVTIWELNTGDVVTSFDRHDGLVTGLAFSPDGSRLASTAEDGTVLVWEIAAKPSGKAPDAAIGGTDEAFRLLASSDAANAQRGMEFLYRRPVEAIKLCAEQVTVPAATPADRVAKLIGDLESEDFPVRQAAVKDLETIGGEAIASLRVAVEKSSNPEVRKLASEALTRIETTPLKADDLRTFRAVELLENVASADARAVLTKWAAGPTGHRLTNEATAALARLKERGN